MSEFKKDRGPALEPATVPDWGGRVDRTPPAFPTMVHVGGTPCTVLGMSLLDWFAGMALSSLLSVEDYNYPVDCAGEAYGIAEAMVAESKKRQEKQSDE